MNEKRRKLKFIPYSHSFEDEDGNEVLCNSTGCEVYDPYTKQWWNEYTDANNNYYYGR